VEMSALSMPPDKQVRSSRDTVQIKICPLESSATLLRSEVEVLHENLMADPFMKSKTVGGPMYLMDA